MKVKHGFIGIGIVVVILIILSTIFKQQTKEIVKITVTNKEVITVNENDNISYKYLIYTTRFNHETNNDIIEVFENTDDIIYGKFASSDLYAMLEIGQTYEVTVTGKRIPILSIYRNIIKIN